MKRNSNTNAVANLLGDTFTTADERAAFERDVVKLVAFAELLKAFDGLREAANISKAELARRVGVKPSVISRLLSGEGRNVQLSTLTDVADALGVYLDVQIRRQPKNRSARQAPIEVTVAT